MSAEICFVNWVSEACRINISRKPLSERISQGRCFRTYVCRHHSHDFSKLSTGFRNPVSQVCPQECHGMSPKSRENVIYKHALRKVWFGYKVSDKARREICITQHVFVMYDRQDLAENVLGKKARMVSLNSAPSTNLCRATATQNLRLQLLRHKTFVENYPDTTVFKERFQIIELWYFLSRAMVTWYFNDFEAWRHDIAFFVEIVDLWRQHFAMFLRYFIQYRVMATLYFALISQMAILYFATFVSKHSSVPRILWHRNPMKEESVAHHFLIKI